MSITDLKFEVLDKFASNVLIGLLKEYKRIDSGETNLTYQQITEHILDHFNQDFLGEDSPFKRDLTLLYDNYIPDEEKGSFMNVLKYMNKLLEK